MIRQPIISVLGHVDHGKTTLLDSIRGTTVQIGEAGGLTQHIGASFIPINIVKEICGELLKRFKVEITIPGLLFIDTPGHESFITLRKRGGSVADLAILVIDINEGFKPQTDESLNFLKQFKTPFIIAATKIDKLPGWYPYEKECFSESFSKQSVTVKNELEKKIYQLVTQLAERGFDAERFDRISNFKKQIAIVPCSGVTGEGVAEVLMMLTGLAQQFLNEKLTLSKVGRGTVLEVKEVRGFGLTIDVILYDGSVRKGDYLVIGGKEPIVTKIKALLRPRPLQEIRIEKRFESVDEINAAAGVKIAAPNLEGVIAGSPILIVKEEKDVEKTRQEIKKEIEEVEFTKDMEGLIVKADTLGSLEALIKLIKDEGMVIRKAEIGHVTKQDVIEAQNVKDDLNKVVLAFNVKVFSKAKDLAKDLKIKIFQSNIIYRLIEEYKEWQYKKKEREIEEKLEKVTRPVKIKLLGGDFVFRVSKPAIFGVNVEKGLLKPGTLMKREDGKVVGKIKEIQKEGKIIKEAKEGEKVAVSMEEVTFGRQIKGGDILISVVSEEDKKILEELKDSISESERELLKTI